MKSLPRNERQVKDIRQRMNAGSKDPLLLMMMCKESMKDFVQAVTTIQVVTATTSSTDKLTAMTRWSLL